MYSGVNLKSEPPQFCQTSVPLGEDCDRLLWTNLKLEFEVCEPSLRPNLNLINASNKWHDSWVGNYRFQVIDGFGWEWPFDTQCNDWFDPCCKQHVFIGQRWNVPLHDGRLHCCWGPKQLQLQIKMQWCGRQWTESCRFCWPKPKTFQAFKLRSCRLRRVHYLWHFLSSSVGACAPAWGRSSWKSLKLCCLVAWGGWTRRLLARHRGPKSWSGMFQNPEVAWGTRGRSPRLLGRSWKTPGEKRIQSNFGTHFMRRSDWWTVVSVSVVWVVFESLFDSF